MNGNKRPCDQEEEDEAAGEQQCVLLHERIESQRGERGKDGSARGNWGVAESFGQSFVARSEAVVLAYCAFARLSVFVRSAHTHV